jgi:hypothetical protein
VEDEITFGNTGRTATSLFVQNDTISERLVLCDDNNILMGATYSGDAGNGNVNTNTIIRSGGSVQLWTKNTGTWTEGMRLTSDGDVGIGTTSPSYTLDVNGEIYSNSKIGAQTRLYVGDDYSTNSSYKFTVDSSYSQFRVNSGVNERFLSIYNNPSNDKVALNVASSGSTDNDLLINPSSGGNVGIGTTSPTYTLDVNGIINTNNNLYASGNVGIGTTSPGYNLDVIGIGRFNNGSTS